MLDQVKTYLKEVDSFAAIAFLNQQKDALAVMKTYSSLVLQLYWEAKNIPAVVAMARAGIQYGLTAAAILSDPDQAQEVKNLSKTLAYNLASFTWPGWQEAGISLNPSDLALGFDAARTSLRLTQDLALGDLALSRAYWILGGHYLAQRNIANAARTFGKAETHAQAVQAEADRLLAKGFALLTILLASPHNAKAQEALDAVKQDLGKLDHGQQFIQQIETAWQVFKP